MFRRIFGESKSKSFVNNEKNQDSLRTINHLKQSEDLINKKIEKLNEDISDAEKNARQCLKQRNPDKNGALRFLKRRKQLEQQRDNLWQMKQNVELINEQVQTSQFNQQVTETLNIGQKHLQQTHKLMSTKKIERILDNINEQIDVSNDIDHLLSLPIQTDDFDLENELNNLNNEIIHQNILEINLPNVHSEKLPDRQIDQTEQQLKQLEQFVAQ